MVEEPAWPILKNGDRGPNVKALQFLLQNQGYSNVTADSEFGLVTQNAVADFQNNHSLNADGMAGRYTLEKLTENYEIYYPTQGLAAKAAQALLQKFESVSVDGDFDLSCAHATYAFQSRMGFPEHELVSAVGYWTWRYMFGYDYYPDGGPGSPSNEQPVSTNYLDYLERPLFSETEWNDANANLMIYYQVQIETGIPWNMLAAIHYRENKFSRISQNSDGPYQVEGSTYQVGVALTDTQFLYATRQCANFLLAKGVGQLDLTKADNVKRAFYLYNMDDNRYINQAMNMGFSYYQATIGEGSPYVMNKADVLREPLLNPNWGQILKGPIPGSTYMHYPANRKRQTMTR